MKTIVQNLATEYSEEGQGPVVLMLHGWKDDLHTFDSITPSISKTHRVIRLDLPGFGGSEMPKRTWQISDYGRFVATFAEKKGIDVAALVGHSFGGRVSIKGVATGLLKPKKLVLIASAGVARKRKLKNKLLGIVAKIGRLVTLVPPLAIWRNELRRKLYAAIGSDYFSAGALKHIYLEIIREDLTGYVPDIEIPTLLIWGREDASTPLEQGERIHSLIRHSRLEVIDAAGHFVHREKPEKVAAFINSFI